MEAVLSWDVDAVLLELQTSMIENELVVSHNADPTPRPQIINKVKQLIANASKALEESASLIVEINPDYFAAREIYYQNVRLFKNQSSVDSAVNRICQILVTPQWDLGLLSTSKGLIYGPVVIKLRTGESIDCSLQPGGTLIPQDIPYGARFETEAKFGLIIEKDAAFQNLLSSGLSGPLTSCILITGKGYPDMNTRFLVKELSVKLCLPFFAIVDGDPHGIDIFFNYKYGSMAKIYMNKMLAAPSIFWLGIHPRDLVDLMPSALQPLSVEDERKARYLLRRPYVQNDAQLREQIQLMIQQSVKCEIENVTSISSRYLSEVYIPAKISLKKFI